MNKESETLWEKYMYYCSLAELAIAIGDIHGYMKHMSEAGIQYNLYVESMLVFKNPPEKVIQISSSIS
jgi:hypothetical protein